MKWTLVVLTLIALAGCATAPIARDPVTEAARPGASLVVIQRDSSVMPVASLPVAVFVDGNIVGSLDNGRVMKLYLNDGHRSIGVATVAQSAPTKPLSEIDVSVGNGEAPVLRVHYVAAGWGGLKIEPVRQ